MLRSCWFLVKISLFTSVIANFKIAKAYDAHSSQSSFDNTSDTYEDMTYDQMVSELNRKKKLLNQSMNMTSTTPEVQNIKTHVGLGYINSFSTIRVGPGQFQRYQNGMQISFGTDLSDPQWFGELCFRNFGSSAYGNEELNLKELQLKIGHISESQGPWAYFLSTGFSNRFMKYEDRDRNLNANDTTPSWIGTFGFRARVNRSLSFSFELLGRTALISSTADTSGLDFGFRLDTSL